MNHRNSSAFRQVLVLAVAVLVFPLAANAGLLFLSGDTNISTALGGSTPDAGNQQFFLNVLGSGSAVLVLEDTQYASVFATAVDDFYDLQGGVSSTLFSGTVTGASLTGVDLFVSPLPTDSFSASELDALGDFLEAGGSIFFMGENEGFGPAENARINAALVALGSAMSIFDDGLDVGLNQAAPYQILADPFMAGVTTFQYGGVSQVIGGTPVFVSIEEFPIIAYELEQVTPTPEPGTLLLLGAALVSCIRRRRR